MSATLEEEAEIRRLYFAEHWPVGTVSSQLHRLSKDCGSLLPFTGPLLESSGGSLLGSAEAEADMTDVEVAI